MKAVAYRTSVCRVLRYSDGIAHLESVDFGEFRAAVDDLEEVEDLVAEAWELHKKFCERIGVDPMQVCPSRVGDLAAIIFERNVDDLRDQDGLSAD